MERFYYKSKDGTGFLNLKSAITDKDYIQITEEEFNKLTKPKELTAEQKAAQEKAKKIAEYKKYLANLRTVLGNQFTLMATGYLSGTNANYDPVEAIFQSGIRPIKNTDQTYDNATFSDTVTKII